MRGRVLKFSIVILATSGSLFWLYRPRPALRNMNAPLTSVYVYNGFVFACNGEGFYKASLKTRQWTPLGLSPFVSPCGHFAGSPRRPDLYYYTSALRIPGLKGGLWCSHDEGNSWQRVLDRRSISQVYISPKGIIYSLQTDRASSPKSQILMSEDGGIKWKNITHNLQGWIYGIRKDADDPERIACLQEGMLTYIVRSRDMQYHWDSGVAENFWWGPVYLNETHPFRQYMTQTTLYTLNATLGNYFNYPFENSSQINGFDIVPDQTSYEFERSGPKIVHTKLEFFAAESSAVLVDSDDPRQFWSISVLDPSGKTNSFPDRIPGQRRYFPSTTMSHQLPVEKDWPAEGDRKAAGFRTFRVDQTHAYQRQLDLSAFGGFQVPGRYRVQTSYGNFNTADSARGEWIGSFGGETFTVIIK